MKQIKCDACGRIQRSDDDRGITLFSRLELPDIQKFGDPTGYDLCPECSHNIERGIRREAQKRAEETRA